MVYNFFYVTHETRPKRDLYAKYNGVFPRTPQVRPKLRNFKANRTTSIPAPFTWESPPGLKGTSIQSTSLQSFLANFTLVCDLINSISFLVVSAIHVVNYLILRRITKPAYCIYSINRPGRLLNFWTLRVGAYSRWALIKFSPFSASEVCLFCNKTVNANNKTRRSNKARFL